MADTILSPIAVGLPVGGGTPGTVLTLDENGLIATDELLGSFATEDYVDDAVSAEATARNAAITASVSTEATARANADALLLPKAGGSMTGDQVFDGVHTVKGLPASANAGEAVRHEQLTSEQSTRASSDTTLQSNIDAEATARAAADSTLATNLAAELAARAAADASGMLFPIPGFRFDGVSGYGIIADSASLALGTGSFSIGCAVILEDYTPASAIPLVNKYSANNGFKLSLLATGILRLEIGDGASGYTAYDSTSAITNSDRTLAKIVVTVDRVGVATFYVNGTQLGNTVSVAGLTGVTATSSGSIYLFRDGSTYNAGRARNVTIWNYALASSEVAFWSSYGITDRDKWGSFTTVYVSSFTAGADSFSGAAATVTGNIDGIAGQDDNLRIYADGSTGTHGGFRSNVFSSSLNKRYRVTFSYYVASGQSHVGGFEILQGNASNAASTNRVKFTNVFSGGGVQAVTFDAWTTVSVELATDISVASATRLRFNLLDKTSAGTSFTGANSSSDDVMYVRGITVIQVGAVMALESTIDNVADFQWRDSSTNWNDAIISTTGVAMLHNPITCWLRLKTTTNGNEQAGGQTMLPADAYVANIFMYLASGTANRSVGNASGGTQFVSAVSITTTRARPTQTNIFAGAAAASVWVSAGDGNATYLFLQYHKGAF